MNSVHHIIFVKIHVFPQLILQMALDPFDVKRNLSLIESVFVFEYNQQSNCGQHDIKRFSDSQPVYCLLNMTVDRSEEHTSELQSRGHLVCRLLLEKKNN